MQPKPHPMDHFIYHPLSAISSGAQRSRRQSSIDRRDSHEDRDAWRSQGREDDESIASAPRRSIGQRLAALRTTNWHLPLPRVNIREAYASSLRRL